MQDLVSPTPKRVEKNASPLDFLCARIDRLCSTTDRSGSLKTAAVAPVPSVQALLRPSSRAPKDRKKPPASKMEKRSIHASVRGTVHTQQHQLQLSPTKQREKKEEKKEKRKSGCSIKQINRFQKQENANHNLRSSLHELEGAPIGKKHPARVETVRNPGRREAEEDS